MTELLDQDVQESLSTVFALRGGVDTEQRIIRGVVLAEVGPFKTRPGQFTIESLKAILELIQRKFPTGMKSRWSHAGHLGQFLGRWKNYRIEGQKLRADLHIDQTAMMAPPGGGTPYGEYVMTLAASDPGALQSSLVIRPRFVKTNDGPDIWMPVDVLGADVVDDGDAVHGDFLHSREDDEARFKQYLDSYLVGKLITEKPEMSDKTPDQVKQLTAEDVAAIVKQNIDAALAIALKPVQDAAAATLAAQQDAAKQKQRGDLLSRANSVGYPSAQAEELAAMFADGKLSESDALKALIEFKGKASQLPPDDDKDKNKPGSDEQRLSAEWDQDKEIYVKMGVTKTMYVDEGLIQAGLKPETNCLASLDFSQYELTATHV